MLSHHSLVLPSMGGQHTAGEQCSWAGRYDGSGLCGGGGRYSSSGLSDGGGRYGSSGLYGGVVGMVVVACMVGWSVW